MGAPLRLWTTLGLAALAVAPSAHAQLTLRYFGTAGWEITDGKTVVLIDPFLSRLRRIIPNDDTLPGDPRPYFGNDDVAVSDSAVIDRHITRADFILVTHSHYDHVLDLPYIARKTGAIVLGTESTSNFLRVSGIPADRIVIVRGGDDLALGPLSVRVVPSLHGILRRAPNARGLQLPPPSTMFPPDAQPPLRMRDLRIEGGTVAYLVRLGGRQVLAFGSMNYIEREVDGLRPDVVLVGAMPERREVFEYTPRLLKALGYPRLVIPSHWDRFNVGYDFPQTPARERLQSFLDEVRAASPKSRVVVPAYFEPIKVP